MEVALALAMLVDLKAEGENAAALLMEMRARRNFIFAVKIRYVALDLLFLERVTSIKRFNQQFVSHLSQRFAVQTRMCLAGNVTRYSVKRSIVSIGLVGYQYRPEQVKVAMATHISYLINSIY